jgi:Tol biopolymer transport system component
VVFVSGRGSIRQLYVMRTDGTEVRQLTSLPGGAEEPAVSPDGRTVAFTGYPGARDGQTDIYTVPLDGGAPRAVTASRDRREIRPFYLPTGALGWVRPRREKADPDVVLQQVAGSATPIELVSTALSIQNVALSRDGNRLVWVGTRPSERGRNVPEFTFQWRTLASGAETSVRLLPGERITSPAF